VATTFVWLFDVGVATATVAVGAPGAGLAVAVGTAVATGAAVGGGGVAVEAAPPQLVRTMRPEITMPAMPADLPSKLDII